MGCARADAAAQQAAALPPFAAAARRLSRHWPASRLDRSAALMRSAICAPAWLLCVLSPSHCGQNGALAAHEPFAAQGAQPAGTGASLPAPGDAGLACTPGETLCCALRAARSRGLPRARGCLRSVRARLRRPWRAARTAAARLASRPRSPLRRCAAGRLPYGAAARSARARRRNAAPIPASLPRAAQLFARPAAQQR